MEKKIFMKSFLEEGNIYEAEQEDGRILRSLKFRFPVFFNEQELYELDWDNESTIESVLLMRRAKRQLNRVRREKTYESNCFVVYV